MSPRVAFALALVWALVTWNALEEGQGAGLPWTLHNLLSLIAFFVAFSIAWVLGTLGGMLGWFVGRRLGRAEIGAAAGVAGFWLGLALGLVLVLWAGSGGAPPPRLIPLVFVLPLIGPWVATRWLAQPAVRMAQRTRAFLLHVSRRLGEWLVLKRPINLDLRGLALGLLAGSLVGIAALAGLFSYPEAALLAQRIRLRNEPIRTPAGPIELSAWIGLQEQGMPPGSAPPRGGHRPRGAWSTSPKGWSGGLRSAPLPWPRDRDIVVLEMDDWTRGKVMTETSEAAVNARLLRKLAGWQSSAVVLPISPAALTSPPAPRQGWRGRDAWPGPGQPSNPRPSAPGVELPADALNPTNPPLDPAALERAMRDLPLLMRAVHADPRALLCWLPPPNPRFRARPGLLFEFLPRLPRRASITRLEPRQMMSLLLRSGRTVGSAEFDSFYVSQLPSLELVDARGRWAAPLLLAVRGDRGQVSPDPTRRSVGKLRIAGHTIRLAAPGQFLVNIYGSTPEAIFPHVSYSAVLNGSRLYDRRLGRWVAPPEFFRDRIVFLDTLNQPTYDTPVGSMRATELLAAATGNLLGMNPLEPPSPRLELLLLLLFGALAGHLAIGRSPLAGAARMAVMILFYGLSAALLFVWPGVWLPIASVTGAIGFAYLLVAQFVFTVDALELERERRDRARYEQEVAISRAIQTSLLPDGCSRSGAFEIVARSEPAREVGGDFYNLFPLAGGADGEEIHGSGVTIDDEAQPGAEAAESQRHAELNAPAVSAPHSGSNGRVGIVLGDVSGKGVQGAMYMTVATTLVEARAEADVVPEEVLAVANAHLYTKIHRLRMFVTVLYGILDPMTGELEFASAGQVPPVLASTGVPPAFLRARGTPLGALRRARYERRFVHLAPGATLILASDGFIEARSPRGEVLGYTGFLEIVARNVAADPVHALDGIFRDARRFAGGAEDQDDRTLVVIRHHPATETGSTTQR